MTNRTMRPEHQITTAATLIRMIDSQASNPLVSMSALGKVLPLVRQFVAETEARLCAIESSVEVLARVAISKHFGNSTLPIEELKLLAAAAGYSIAQVIGETKSG